MPTPSLPAERQPSAHPLHRQPDESDPAAIIAAADSICYHASLDDEDDANSVASSRSDQSEEAAGLVSRLSDEEDRANRRAKYEGKSRLGAKSTHASATYRLSEEEEDGERERGLESAGGRYADDSAVAGTPEREHSVSASEVRDGVFRDRAGTGQSKRRGNRRGLLARTWEISREALPTLCLSLTSLVLSGELLIHLAKWPVFSKVDKLFILIPILLNLKGNLEGNLSLRMSTSANIGELDVRRTRETLIFGNLALLQVQALIVSLFAGTLSFVLGLGTGAEPAKQVPAPSPSPSVTRRVVVRRAAGFESSRITPRHIIHHHPNLDPSLKLRNSYFEFVLVIATAMLSASMSSAILGSFMCALVVVTRQMGGNPDNIASPLAGSLGDLLTLTLLGLISSFLVRFEGTILATLILVGLAAACVVCFLAAFRNAYVRELLSSGWVPLVLAMFISSGAGVLLDSFVQRFEGFALLVPVLTGLPGACSAIFVSRTSTALHGGMGNNKFIPRIHIRPGSSAGITSWWTRTYDRFVPQWLQSIGGPTEGWLVPTVLFALGMMITITFLCLIRLTGQMTFGVPFFLMFALVSAVGFTSSLGIGHVLTLILWRYDYDPGEYCDIAFPSPRLTLAFSVHRHLLPSLCDKHRRCHRSSAPRYGLLCCDRTRRQNYCGRQRGTQVEQRGFGFDFE